jgi:hypothetical protein
MGEEALAMRIYLLGGMRMVCPVGVVKDGHESLFWAWSVHRNDIILELNWWRQDDV